MAQTRIVTELRKVVALNVEVATEIAMKFPTGVATQLATDDHVGTVESIVDRPPYWAEMIQKAFSSSSTFDLNWTDVIISQNVKKLGPFG